MKQQAVKQLLLKVIVSFKQMVVKQIHPNAAGNTVADGTKSTATTAAGTTITDGAKTNTSTADKM